MSVTPRVRDAVALLAGALVAACTHTASPPARTPSRTDEPAAAVPPPTQPPPAVSGAPSALKEMFPHVWVDVAARIVEFDGTVPIDAVTPLRSGKTPQVYLEVIACMPDTKEHEALVMTRARPSHVHAALLAIGLQPGAPGGFRWDGPKMSTIAPTGDTLEVHIVPDGGPAVPATEWVINAESGAPFAGPARGRWVFAGSRIATRQGREVYDADGTGTLIGLTTFGTETIAWTEVISPDAAVQEPEWIADPARTPRFGAPVRIRVTPAAR